MLGSHGSVVKRTTFQFPLEDLLDSIPVSIFTYNLLNYFYLHHMKILPFLPGVPGIP